MMQPIEARVSGEYNVILTRNAGRADESVEETGFFKNLVLDNFFTYVGSKTAFSFFSNLSKTCRVGTGTQVPSAGQTALVSLLASTSGGTASTGDYTTSALTTADGVTSADITMTFRFTLGSVVGNVSEVGFALPDAGSTTVHSRSLVVDANGNPTTLTVTAADQLTVIYRLKVAVSDTVNSGNITIAGVNYAWTACRSANTSATWFNWIWPSSAQTTTAWNGTFNGVGLTPSGASSGVGCTYPNSGTSRRNFTITAGTTSGNLSGGITAVSIDSLLKVSFTPAIPKDSTKTLSLTVGYTLGATV